MIAAVGFALLFAFAYGGYKRTPQAEAAAHASGAPKSVAPATAASAEFTKAIPAGTVLLVPKQGQEPRPPVDTSACGTDPKTGLPCKNAVQLEQVVVRRVPPNPVPAQQPPTLKEPTPEELRLAAAYQLEKTR